MKTFFIMSVKHNFYWLNDELFYCHVSPDLRNATCFHHTTGSLLFTAVGERSGACERCMINETPLSYLML